MTLVTSAIAALATMAMGLSPMMALVMLQLLVFFSSSTKKHQLIYGYRMDIRVYNIDGRRSWPNAEPLCVYS